MLFKVLKMKSLIYPAIFNLSSKVSPLSSLSSKPPNLLSNPKILLNFVPLSVKPLEFSRRSLLFCCQHRSLQSKPSGFHSSGEIHLIIGPMFAGKTTSLLRRMQAETENGRRVAIIKSDKDTRYGLNSIVTHDGVKLPCWPLTRLSSFKQKFGHDAYDELDVIGIDEAQFFEDLYDFCRDAADHDGKTVIVAGLDGDYLRRSFGSVLDIIPLADSVTKLTARCEICNRSAFFTLRKTEEMQTELIGGAEVYMPVCREHYVNGQAVVEVARFALESQVVQCGSPV